MNLKTSGVVSPRSFGAQCPRALKQETQVVGWDLRPWHRAEVW